MKFWRRNRSSPVLHRMTLGWAIGATSSLALFYLLSVICDLAPWWIWGLLWAAQVATVWMAIRILKDPTSTDKTFDEFFYQDRPDLRRLREE